MKGSSELNSQKHSKFALQNMLPVREAGNNYLYKYDMLR